MADAATDLLQNSVPTDISTTTSDTEAEHLDAKTYSSEDEAQFAADAKKDVLDKSTSSLHVEVIGDPYIIAGATAYLKNFRPGIPSMWHITKVTHKFTENGYETQFEADTKFDETGTAPAGGSGGAGGDTGSDTGIVPTSNANEQAPLPTSDEILTNSVDTTLSPEEKFKDDDPNSPSNQPDLPPDTTGKPPSN